MRVGGQSLRRWPVRLCAAYKVFNAEVYLAYSLRSVYDHVERIVIFLSARPWNGVVVPSDGTEQLIRDFPDPDRKIVLVKDDWRRHETPKTAYDNERIEMNAVLDFVRTQFREVTHYLYIDYDEVYRPEQLEVLKEILSGLPKDTEVRGQWRIYWKSLHYWINPPSTDAPLFAFPITRDVRFRDIRDTDLPRQYVVPFDRFHCPHFSYALPDERLERKMVWSSHADEVQRGWLGRVWRAWDSNRDMMNLQPCQPHFFRRAVRADDRMLPPVMRSHPFHGMDIIR
jgi:hypothetical protein